MNLRLAAPFLTIVMVFGGLLPVPALAVDIKIATVAPEGSTWMKEMRAAARQIKERTAGRVSFRIYGGGIQGNEKKVLRKIRINQLQGGAFTSMGLVERYPDIVVYGLPMLFESQDEVDHVRARFDARLVKGLDEAGFVSYGFAGGGFAYLMTNAPVSRLDDLKGQKIWVPEGDEPSYVAMQSLGLSPIVLPLTDVMTALETGLLNIVAMSPVGAIVLQWHTKTSHITNLPLSYTQGLLAIDKRALAGVSADDQAVIREVMTALYARFDAQNREDNLAAMEALKAAGLEVVETDPAEVARWRQAVSASVDKLVAEGPISDELLTEIRSTLAEFRQRRTGPSR